MRRLVFAAASFAVAATSGCLIAVIDDADSADLCGQDAWYDLDYRECFCPSGWVGDPYEQCDPALRITVTDACDDQLDIEFKLWSTDREHTWPESELVYSTDGLDRDTVVEIRCDYGETICFGGAAGELVWDLGLDGPEVRECSDCCVACDGIDFDLGYLTCG